MIVIQALMTRSAALIAAALAGVIDAISHSESFHKHSIGISGKFPVLCLSGINETGCLAVNNNDNGRTTVLNHA